MSVTDVLFSIVGIEERERRREKYGIIIILFFVIF